MMPPFRVDLPAMVNATTGMAAITPKIHFARKITVTEGFFCDNSPDFRALRLSPDLGGSESKGRVAQTKEEYPEQKTEKF